MESQDRSFLPLSARIPDEPPLFTCGRRIRNTKQSRSCGRRIGLSIRSSRRITAFIGEQGKPTVDIKYTVMTPQPGTPFYFFRITQQSGELA
jgi:hypothetical protein